MGQYCFACCCRHLTLPACEPAGHQARGNKAWERCRWSGQLAAGRVGGWAADTAQRASTVTSR